MLRAPFFVIAIAVAAAACSRAPSPDSSPAIHLDTTDPQQAIVEVSGLAPRDLSAISELDLTADEWYVVLRIAVRTAGAHSGADRPAVAGQYAVGDSIRFIPSFPLDPGREYDVSFDPSRVSRATIPRIPASHAVVSLPRLVHTPSTIVTAVYPSGDVILENQLRMYVQFSGPMGQAGGLDHLALLDKAGHELVDAMLPLDTALWNNERTRYTIILDPGRVKREILPNRMMGRPLRRGETITLVVKRDWLDGRGVPLKAEFRRDYRVAPAIERPLDTAEWRIAPPRAGTRDALTIAFPAPLDQALLGRAVGVSRAAAAVPGELRIAAGETRCVFVPRDPWQPGDYALVVSPILEDVAGNRIGRAFEVRSPGGAVPPENSQPTSVSFRVTPSAER